MIIANSYTFWPAFAYANTSINCPAIFGVLSYDVNGAAQVVAAPLYSEMQLVVPPWVHSFGNGNLPE